jgi:hypothetical protein
MRIMERRHQPSDAMGRLHVLRISGYPIPLRSLFILLQSLSGDMFALGTPSMIHTNSAHRSARSCGAETTLSPQPFCVAAKAVNKPFDSSYPTMVVLSNGGQTLLPTVPGRGLSRQPAGVTTRRRRVSSRLTTQTCSARLPCPKVQYPACPHPANRVGAKATAKVVDQRPITAGKLVPSRSGARTL